MFFPVFPTKSTRLFPTVTILLLANTVVFTYQLSLGSLEFWEFTRSLGLHSEVLGQVYFLSAIGLAVSSSFFHGGFWHYFANMLFLFILGPNVEGEFGRLNFLFFIFWAVSDRV